jgi:hypothetical protein
MASVLQAQDYPKVEAFGGYSFLIDYLGEMRFTLSKRNGQFYALDVQIPD